MATSNKQYEKSPADKEMPGKPEGSKAEEAADAKMMKRMPGMPAVRQRTPSKNKASVI